MRNFSLTKILGKGLIIAIPLGIVVYVLMKFLDMFKKIIEPLSEQFGVQKLFGQLTLTILTVFSIVLVVFILGLLMRINFLESFGKNLEEVVMKFFPSLQQLKVTAAEKLNLETNSSSWKPVLVCHENKYNAAFVIEKKDDLITLFVIKGIEISDGEVLITKQSEVELTDISSKELHQFTKHYGKCILGSIKENIG
jgi:uncharacterized membrane protein